MTEIEQRKEVMRLAVKHRLALWAFVKGLTKDSQMAEDVLQDAFVVITEKYKNYQSGTNFLAWARQIIRFKYLAQIDPKRRRLVSVEADVLEQAMVATEPAEDGLFERRAALQVCMGRLNERIRKAMELRYRDDLDLPSIAQQLGLSQNSLYTLLSRAREAIRNCVEKRTIARGHLP